MGTIGPVCFQILKKELQIEEDVEVFRKRFIEHLNSLLPQSKLMKGASDLIHKFHDMGVPMALATCSNRDNLEAKTTNHKQLFSLIPFSTCGNEVSKGKPDPEVFLKSMQKLGIDDPRNCLVFEDSPGGIKAAVDGGMASVMVPDKGFPYMESLNKFGVKPTLILDSLEDFDVSAFRFVV
jgi:pseudouridine-5'-monophosphatase